ncbi:protein lingerer isoform X2 [Hetaerina americana]|uniref:protein lingerer isoform X2 n=1 Tax=Hetaerina americana TaxID=62018 RepID=UPI003A7F3436
MSSASRTTTRGGKGGKPESTAGGKSQKSDAKSDSPKALDLNPKIQPTAEQMRIAQIIDTRSEDPDLKDKIKQVMDATRKTEDEVCTALHDCDNDPDRAVNMLLEGMGTGEWEMSGKKKKNRQPGTNTKPEGPVNNREDPGGDWCREREGGGGGGGGGAERERSRTRGSGPPRMRGRGSLDSRGWRGRENKENEKNLEDSRGDIPRRGGRMMNGPGGRSGRGGRGGRLGPRTFQNRERGGFPRSIDTWNNPQVEDSSADPIKMGQLGVSMTPNSLLEDWDNEEYTGSLADTKVFTPSNSVQPTNPEPLQDSTNQDIASPVPQTLSSSLSPNSDQMSQNLDLASTLQQNNQAPAVTPNSVGVGVMTPAQSQYLSQLTQATESLKSAVGLGSNSTPVSNSTQSYGPVSSASTNNYPVTSSAAYHTPSPTAFTSTTDALSASFSTSSFGGSAASYSSQMKVQATGPPAASQSTVTQSLPARTKTQRPRVPPPSKIPSTAVEMPGDAINSSISFLDVQFGGLEFGSETSSFDFSSDQSKFSGAATGNSMDSVSNSGTSSAMDLNATSTSKSQSANLDGYSGSSQQSSKEHTQAGISLGQNQKLSGPENIPFPSNQNAEHKPSQPAFSQPRVSGSGSSSMDIGKSDAGLSYSASSTVTYQNSYQNQKPSATVYQAPSSYSTSSGYTSSQAQSSSTPYQNSQSQNSFPQSQSNSGYASQATNSSYSSSQASNSTPSYSSAQSVVGGNAVSGSAGVSSSGNSSGSYASSQPSVSSSSSYQSSGSQSVPAPTVSSSSVATSSAYQVAGSTASTPSAPPGPPSSFPSSMSQSASANSSYPSQSTYQSSGQSGYASSSMGQSSGSSGGYTSSAGQYQNSYGSSSVATSQSHSALHTTGTGGSKIGSSLNASSKEPQFEATTTTSSNLSSTIPATTSSALSTNVNVSPALGLPTSSQTVNASNSSSTKVSSSTGKAGGLPNIPPGVPPIMGTQYIMSQTGLPYFAGVQQPVFSYEELQLMQQRIPHMAGYYDLGYQAPTSLATGREGGLASVAYSVSDGRYARTDNNSSPVPSTLSQQNPSQAHQQPMINPTALPPGYAYFYGGGMVPAGSFQYGTPAIYPMPTATNAHGATNNTQYPKPASYGSAYGSGYDGISQNQEYGKTGYVSGNQSQSKGGVGGNSGTAGSSASDLGATMYGKSHVALGKVNSYDKQGFHSGTPPPFSMPGTQTTPMGAPSGAYPPHLFIPTMAPHQQHHSTTLMHQPLHTMEMRNPGRRSESGSTSGQRSQSSNQPNKSGGKQGYSGSYWANN